MHVQGVRFAEKLAQRLDLQEILLLLPGNGFGLRVLLVLRQGIFLSLRQRLRR